MPPGEPADKPLLRVVRRSADEQRATRHAPGAPPRPGRSPWPAKLGPVSKALAVGVAAHNEKAGLSWLRHKIGQKTARRGPPFEALVPPRAAISLARVWKKSSLQGWEDSRPVRHAARGPIVLHDGVNQ